MKKRPRQIEVAALAHVSPAIVSLVINGRVNGNVRISQETQQKVWDAVKELGYVVNPVARKLAGNQSRMLGVFTYQAIFPLEYHDFYYPFLIGIEEEAQAQDYDLLLFTRAAADGKRAIYKNGVNSLQVADGAILLGVYEEASEITQLLQDGFPFVYVGRREIEGLAYVAADYAEVTAQVVAYMYRMGHRRIAHLFFDGGDLREAHRDRHEGYVHAHQQLEMPLDERLVVGCELSQMTRELVQRCLLLGVTAVLVEEVDFLLKLQEVVAELGLRMPQDLSFALLGDPLNETQRQADVTGFSIPRHEMGREAVRLLIDLLAEETLLERRHIALPCTLVKGKTVVPPASR